jgi:hypothetical protein
MSNIFRVIALMHERPCRRREPPILAPDGNPIGPGEEIKA